MVGLDAAAANAPASEGRIDSWADKTSIPERKSKAATSNFRPLENTDRNPMNARMHNFHNQTICQYNCNGIPLNNLVIMVIIAPIVHKLLVVTSISGPAPSGDRPRGRLLLMVALALWIGGHRAAVRAQEAPGSEAPMLTDVSTPSSKPLSQKEILLTQIVREIGTDPAKAPDIVKSALLADLPNPIVFAGQVVQSAIHTLLRPIPRAQISALIL